MDHRNPIDHHSMNVVHSPLLLFSSSSSSCTDGSEITNMKPNSRRQQQTINIITPPPPPPPPPPLITPPLMQQHYKSMNQKNPKSFNQKKNTNTHHHHHHHQKQHQVQQQNQVQRQLNHLHQHCNNDRMHSFQHEQQQQQQLRDFILWKQQQQYHQHQHPYQEHCNIPYQEQYYNQQNHQPQQQHSLSINNPILEKNAYPNTTKVVSSSVSLPFFPSCPPPSLLLADHTTTTSHSATTTTTTTTTTDNTSTTTGNVVDTSTTTDNASDAAEAIMLMMMMASSTSKSSSFTPSPSPPMICTKNKNNHENNNNNNNHSKIIINELSLNKSYAFYKSQQQQQEQQQLLLSYPSATISSYSQKIPVEQEHQQRYHHPTISFLQQQQQQQYPLQHHHQQQLVYRTLFHPVQNEMLPKFGTMTSHSNIHNHKLHDSTGSSATSNHPYSVPIVPQTSYYINNNTNNNYLTHQHHVQHPLLHNGQHPQQQHSHQQYHPYHQQQLQYQQQSSHMVVKEDVILLFNQNNNKNNDNNCNKNKDIRQKNQQQQRQQQQQQMQVKNIPIKSWYPKNPLYRNIFYSDDYITLDQHDGHNNNNSSSNTMIQNKVQQPNCENVNTSLLLYQVLFDPDDGKRFHELFCAPIPNNSNIVNWITERKCQWRKNNYKVYKYVNTNHNNNNNNKKRKTISDDPNHQIHYNNNHSHDTGGDARYYEQDRSGIRIDFWCLNGYLSLQDWLLNRKGQWKVQYSWNRTKRLKLEQDYHYQGGGIDIHILKNNFQDWITIRKNQWRILRRKRQRYQQQQQQQQLNQTTMTTTTNRNKNNENDLHNQVEDIVAGNVFSLSSSLDLMKSTPPVVVDVGSGSGTAAETDALTLLEHGPTIRNNNIKFGYDDIIDAIITDQEKMEQSEREKRNARVPLDISFLFDSELGCPDDVVVHIIQYLDPIEHYKLVCLNKQKRKFIQQREMVWKLLCPSHWLLPRRPRQPWYKLYFDKYRLEMESIWKKWDDVLVECSKLLTNGDSLSVLKCILLNRSNQNVRKRKNDSTKDCTSTTGKKETSSCSYNVNYISNVVLERNSVLNLAVITQRRKVTRWLIEEMGADIETCDRGYFTPLLNAAYNGDKIMVRYLLVKGADRTKLGTFHSSTGLAPSNFLGYTAEQWAMKRGHEEVAELIRQGV